MPTIVFLHGALNDHTVWDALGARLAAQGWNVLAPDLPGHGAQADAALPSVEALADWVAALLAERGIEGALLAGHSMGSLIALETARRAPQRVAALALLGTSWPMPVADALLAMARDDETAAIELVAQWSHADAGRQPDASGSSPFDATRALMLRLAQAHPGAHVLHTDLRACNAYAGGASAAAAVLCPTLFILGSQDRMTPARKAKTLTDAIAHGRIVSVDAGHALMAEQPDAVLAALARFGAEVFQVDEQ
jgi:pimeloyl-ACP methyl ester carboxylesterase